MLKEEIDYQTTISDLQREWYDAKRVALAQGWYGKYIFTYDENGLQQYLNERNKGLDALEKLTYRNSATGKFGPYSESANAQLNYLYSIVTENNTTEGQALLESLLTNDDNTKIGSSVRVENGEIMIKSTEDTSKDLTDQELEDARVSMMENFWDNLDNWKETLDGIYDDYQNALNTAMEKRDESNQILQKIVDNQISVEEDILKAIETREQDIIDELQDTRDALEDSNTKFINGLQQALTNEQNIYNNNEADTELTKLQRQLNILMRSGGSAAQIKSLQDQIESKQKDIYFDKQQDTIDAIQEASDAQLEKMDTQIDILTKTLEYNKENGIFWAEVDTWMGKSETAIQDFIQTYTEEYKSNATRQIREDLRDLKNRLEQWIAHREDAASDDTNPLVQYQYASGGIVDYTGLAWVDGTPNKPEAFLNAEQTAALRDILSNGVNPLTITLSGLETTIDNTSIGAVPVINSSESIIIENASVNVNVAKIANDYDSKQVGVLALEEMVKIARKSGPQSLSRR